jgi:hypothetical protein
MSIKLVLLKSGETIISDAKELVTPGENPESQKVIGYIFNKPHKVNANKPMVFLAEGQDPNSKDRTIEITLSPWILLTKAEDIPVPTDFVVTVVEPIDSLVNMYQEKINGN